MSTYALSLSDVLYSVFLKSPGQGSEFDMFMTKRLLSKHNHLVGINKLLGSIDGHMCYLSHHLSTCLSGLPTKLWAMFPQHLYDVVFNGNFQFYYVRLRIIHLESLEHTISRSKVERARTLHLALLTWANFKCHCCQCKELETQNSVKKKALYRC
jgi:hypothetical protein